ncbi:MAG: hypothetical protein Q9168_001714 [Polycauliona sp. 1 TL-2023]
MSGVEVVGLVAAVLSAVRIMPEIPKVWRRVLGRPDRNSSSSNAVVVRTHKDTVNPRTGSHTHIDRELEIRQSDNQRIVTSEMLKTFATMADNQTLTHLSSNYLHASNAAITTRAHEATLSAFHQLAALEHRRAESQRTVWICCGIIIAYLAYFLGVSRGENRLLKAALQSRSPPHHGQVMPIIMTPPTDSAPPPSWGNNIQPLWRSVPTDCIRRILLNAATPDRSMVAAAREFVASLLTLNNLLWSIFATTIGYLQLSLSYHFSHMDNTNNNNNNDNWPLRQKAGHLCLALFFLGAKCAMLVKAHLATNWTMLVVFFDLLWLFIIARPFFPKKRLRRRRRREQDAALMALLFSTLLNWALGVSRQMRR